MNDISKQEKWKTFILKKMSKETHDVSSLIFEPTDGKNYSFTPGQFVTIRLPKGISEQEKQYTISSKPTDRFLSLTVKKTGTFSTLLHEMKIGDELEIDKPYGYFRFTDKMKKIIFLAGGIGIIPFYDMLAGSDYNLLKDKKIKLLYSNKNRKDIIYFEFFEKLKKDLKNFEVIYSITQEKKTYREVQHYERFDIHSIKHYLGGIPKNTYFFICGTIDFVDSIWEQLSEAGVPEEYLKTEAFY